MRSLLIATAMCAAALTFTGCSITSCGPCNSLSNESQMNGSCGCQDAACNECATCAPKQLIGSWKGQPECAGVDVGEGAPCGLENVSMPKPKGLLSRLGGMRMKSTFANDRGCDSGDCGSGQCGCDPTTAAAPAPVAAPAPMVAPMAVAPSISDCGCGSGSCDGRCGRVRARTQARADLGMRLFDRGSECGSDCGGNCGGTCGDTAPVSDLGTRWFQRGSKCGSDCGGNCGGACGDTAPVSDLGMRWFQRGSECGPDCNGNCGGGCGNTEMVSTQGGILSRSRTMRDQGGCMQDGMAGRMQGGPVGRMQASSGRGCGRFGCGRDGKLCLTCNARTGMMARDANASCGSGNCGICNACRQKARPYAGEIPHAAMTPGMTGQIPQYVYPYYTTRGPRDFLMANPPTIGY